MCRKTVFLIEAEIFLTKLCKQIIPKPLKNLYSQLGVNTFRYCGEMAGIEEIYIPLETLTSLHIQYGT